MKKNTKRATNFLDRFFIFIVIHHRVILLRNFCQPISGRENFYEGQVIF
jgi:hypothetical protein